MSREIRRVPVDWQHPRDEKGNYIPMHDEDYETASTKWKSEFAAWENGTHTSLEKHPELKGTMEFWERDSPPDPDVCRPKFIGEPTHYQIYEDVSEGTPVSPIFATLEDMKVWLISQGFSEYASTEFIRVGWAPSMVFLPGKGISGIGIHSFDMYIESEES